MTSPETLEYHRKWRLSNQEKVKLYRQNNREKQKEWSRQWRDTHKEKCREYVKLWKSNNPEKSREINANARLKMYYGITLEDYNRMLEEQGGCCAICGKPSTDYKRNLHVDHDHLTGKVRGLLCVRCNYGIGYFGEDTTLLENAKVYLTKYAGLKKVKDFC
jgi:hypothetical protein